MHAIVKEVLKSHCELSWATTVVRSREIIKQGDIDIVLLDVGLPDSFGLDLIEDIEKLVPQPKIIIYSAMDVTK